MSASVHALGRSVGFLGKVPSQPDFVRQNIGDRVGAEFDPWLVKSAQNLLLSKSEWPEGAVRFVFSAPQSDAVVIGALGKSHDQVGRTFPLAVYTSLAIGHATRAFHAIPLIHGAFLEQAAAVVADAPSLTLEALRERAASLPTPSDDQVMPAVQRCAEVLAASPSHELFARAFAGQPADGHAYGLYTFLMAAEAARNPSSTGAPTVLACPIANDVDLVAWLDLSRRCLDWRDMCPSFAWVESGAPRLMLSLGFASDQLLYFAADPRNQSSRLWPLTTERSEAIARARDALSADLLAPEARTLDGLWTRLSRGRR
jgi:type VI secretion system protein ImpM